MERIKIGSEEKVKFKYIRINVEQKGQDVELE